MDWVVVRNRSSHIEARNQRRIDEALTELSQAGRLPRRAGAQRAGDLPRAVPLGPDAARQGPPGRARHQPPRRPAGTARAGRATCTCPGSRRAPRGRLSDGPADRLSPSLGAGRVEDGDRALAVAAAVSRPARRRCSARASCWACGPMPHRSEIIEAHRRLIAMVHPDRGGTNEPGARGQCRARPAARRTSRRPDGASDELQVSPYRPARIRHPRRSSARRSGPDDARAIGRGFATLLREAGGKKVAVGYDGRVSSPMLEHALIEGLTASGCDVVRIGMGPTPMLYYAEASAEQVDGGIQITGSHNPANYNGFKMVFQGRPFFGAGHPDARPAGRGRRLARRDRQGRTSRDPRRLYRSPAGRPRRHRSRAARRPQGRLGRGQRRRRPRARGAGRAAAGRAFLPLHRSRRQLSQPSSRSHCPREPDGSSKRSSPRRTSTSELHSTATATGSARSTAKAASSGATSC